MKPTAAALVVLGVVGSAWGAERPPTCDREQIAPPSYRLTTRAQGLIVTTQDYGWWDAFDLGKHEDVLADLDQASAYAATRAAQLDPANLMAHALLARQYLVLAKPEQAEAAWRTVFDAGGAVVWTTTLYNVDGRSFFFMAFDPRGIRLYRFGAVVGPGFKQGFGGVPEMPSADLERFWAAWGGCLDPALRPESEIPWADVREIKAGNWVLWFKLTRPVTVSSDRGKRKTLRELKVNLHGPTGALEVYKPVGEDYLAMRGRGPAGYQDLVRRTLVKFVDPERRIHLPPLEPGLGW